MIIKKMFLPKNQYYPVVQHKTQIYLHHTAGSNATSAIRWWGQTREHVGVAYVIDRDGTIYQAFEDNCWAYHLGVKGKTDIEKNSIGIEIVSLGHLEKLSADLYAFDIGTRKVPVKAQDVITLSKPWRGHLYYHAYTDAQVKAVVELVKMLSEKYHIAIPFEKTFYEYDEQKALGGSSGLYSHTSVRKDKDDIYPDPKLISALSSAFGKLDSGSPLPESDSPPENVRNNQSKAKGKKDKNG